MEPEVQKQLDRIESKLDDLSDHLQDTREGLVRAERDIKWLQGSIKFSLSAIVTVIAGIAGWLVSLIKLH